MSRPENIAVVGMPGSGKSYALRAWLRADPRVIYVDPMDSARGVGGAADNEDWTHLCRRTSSVLDLVTRRARFRVSFGVGDMDDAERREAIGEILEAAMKAPGGRASWTTVAVDEIGVVCPRGQEMPELDRALRMGRHRSVRIALASQRAVDMPPTWRALCEQFVIFRQAERIDLDRLDTIQKGLGARAQSLDVHQFYEWTGGHLYGPMAPVAR